MFWIDMMPLHKKVVERSSCENWFAKKFGEKRVNLQLIKSSLCIPCNCTNCKSPGLGQVLDGSRFSSFSSWEASSSFSSWEASLALGAVFDWSPSISWTPGNWLWLKVATRLLQICHQLGCCHQQTTIFLLFNVFVPPGGPFELVVLKSYFTVGRPLPDILAKSWATIH